MPSRHAAREEFLVLASVCRDFEGTIIELQPDTEFSPTVYDLLADFSLAGQDRSTGTCW